jgi:hypothetical protein
VNKLEGTWSGPLTKLKGCGKLLSIPFWYASKESRYKQWGVNSTAGASRKSKKLVLVANRETARFCGRYRSASWYRRTNVILCEDCIKRLGIVW